MIAKTAIFQKQTKKQNYFSSVFYQSLSNCEKAVRVLYSISRTSPDIAKLTIKNQDNLVLIERGLWLLKMLDRFSLNRVHIDLENLENLELLGKFEKPQNVREQSGNFVRGRAILTQVREFSA